MLTNIKRTYANIMICYILCMLGFPGIIMSCMGSKPDCMYVSSLFSTVMHYNGIKVCVCCD